MTDDGLPDLDMASALTILGDAVSGVVVAALAGTGLRHSHGYLIQRLLEGPATATEIADELGVTQQAVSKSVRDLVTLGHVELGTSEEDRRRRPVQLTERGRRAVATARRARRGIDDQLREALGDQGFEDAMRSLVTMLDGLGLEGAVRRRRVPPPVGELS